MDEQLWDTLLHSSGPISSKCPAGRASLGQDSGRWACPVGQ